MLLSCGVRRSLQRWLAVEEDLKTTGEGGSQPLPHKARSCPQASPTSASTAATSPSLR